MIIVRHKRGFDWARWFAETIITFLEATGLMFLAIMARFNLRIIGNNNIDSFDDKMIL